MSPAQIHASHGMELAWTPAATSSTSSLRPPVKRGLWEKIRQVTERERVSISELMRQLAESYLNGSQVLVEYWDSVHFANLPRPPGLARRRCVGWIVEETRDCVKILSDMPVEKLPGEITSLGSAGYTISRADIIRLQRIGCA